MVRRIAASLALVAFAVCILVGLQAENPFATVVFKALVAMAVTFAVGLVIGAAAQKMLDENLAGRPPVANTAGKPADAAAAASAAMRDAGGR